MQQFFSILFFTLISIFGYARAPLVVSYATTHLNQICDGVIGVLITPTGEKIETAPLNPYQHANIVVDVPIIGDYQAYFEVIDSCCCNICAFAGGISAILCDHPEKPLEFQPKESLIQLFPLRQNMVIGTKSAPVANFKILAEDL